MRWLTLSAALALAGCSSGGWAMVSGQIGEYTFDEAVTVYHGGPFIMLMDREVDCLDMSWVAKTYNESQAPTDINFLAMQFAFDDDEPSVGVFSVEGEAPIYASGLRLQGGVFELYRGRTGQLVVDDAGHRRDDPIVGSFQITFADQSAINGEFETEWCRNMRL